MSERASTKVTLDQLDLTFSNQAFTSQSILTVLQQKKKYLHLKRAELKVPMLREKCVVLRQDNSKRVLLDFDVLLKHTDTLLVYWQSIAHACLSVCVLNANLLM